MSRIPRACFVAGTDTGVGKTLAAVAITRALARGGLRVATMKPVAAGASATPDGLRNDDATALAEAANVAAPYELINPYCFAAPVSPHLAAQENGVIIDTEVIRAAFARLAADADCVVVEGAGGWLAPIGPDRTMEDVAAALGLPVILIVGLRLGCLNHAALTARALSASNLRLCGWIGNRIDPAFERADENIAALVQILRLEPIAVLPFSAAPRPRAELDQAAASRLAAAFGVSLSF